MPSQYTPRAGTIDPAHWVERYQDDFYRFAYNRLEDTHAAEDVVQETFLAGLMFVDQYRGEGSEKSWLFTILRRKTVDCARMRARDGGRDASNPSSNGVPDRFAGSGSWDADSVPCDADPSRIVENREIWRLLQDSLEAIPRNQANVFVLRVLDGLCPESVCRILRISQSNLHVRFHRARTRLAAFFLKRWQAPTLSG